MASAELELQGAIVQRLKADQTLAELNGGVFDRIPENATRPYVNIGDMQTLREDATCLSGAQIYLTLHAWSDAVGFPEVRRIADAVVDALHLAPISLTSARLVSLMHRQTRVFRDPNEITSHAVIEFVANIEKPTA